jgi:alkylation response protein AidB-like acyl-CoA dehydrogenase
MPGTEPAVEIIPPLTSLTEDEAMLRDTVRQFAQQEIAPHVREMDEAQHLDAGILRQLFGLGLMAIEAPLELGGAGASFFSAVLAVEEISRVDPAVAVIVDVQNTLAVNALLRWGSLEQQRRWIPKMAESTVCAYALSEAGSGSDAFSLATQARADGDGFVLNGRKLWISNAMERIFF